MNVVSKFITSLAVTILIMVVFRTLALTVYTVGDDSLEPCFVSGDRVLVNRWSYGLRTGGGPLFSYVRWMAQPLERGDLVAYNCPADSGRRIASRQVFFGYCTAASGDTVRIRNARLIVPGRERSLCVTADNVRLIAYLYNRFEGRKAVVKDGKLLVDGRQMRCARFANDYYWLYSGRLSCANDSRLFGLVPENHIIGRVSMLLYSIDGERPLDKCLRTERSMLFVGKPTDEHEN